MNYLQILIDAAKAHLENEVDAEKKLMLEKAIEHFISEDKEKQQRIEEARRKGYSHTFCGIDYSLADNPFCATHNKDEWEAWRDGYYTGIYET